LYNAGVRWSLVLVFVLALGRCLAGDAGPVTVCDFRTEKPVAAGEPFLAFARERNLHAEFGTPWFFSIHDGLLHLASRRGPRAASWNPANLTKGENKVILALRGGPGDEAFRVPLDATPRLEVRMAPVRLPGKGADLTDPKKNDACFYLLVSLDGPRHRYRGEDLADTIGYVWADGAWRSGAEVGRDGKYDEFMRYLALGRGPDRLGELRTFTRDVRADAAKTFPERAAAATAVVKVGIMVDSNTVDSEAESLLESVRFLPPEATAR
jgi:hypothetical protein